MLKKFNQDQVWLRVLKILDINALYCKNSGENSYLVEDRKTLRGLPIDFQLLFFKKYLENITYYNWQIFIKWLKENNIFEDYIRAMIVQHIDPFQVVYHFQDERTYSLLTMTLYWRSTAQGHDFWHKYHDKLVNDMYI